MIHMLDWCIDGWTDREMGWCCTDELTDKWTGGLKDKLIDRLKDR